MKKLNLGEGGIQGLLTRHVEKIIFGVCLLLVALFIFSGLRLRGYDGEPTQMQTLAKQARENIERDTWESVATEEERITLTNYSEAVKTGNAPTEAGTYRYVKPLQPIFRPQLAKRADPQLLTPDNLITYSVTAPMAVKESASRGPDKLAELETRKEETPKERKPDRREQRGRGGNMRSGGMPGGGNMRSGGMPGGGSMRSGGIPGGGGQMPGGQSGMPFSPGEGDDEGGTSRPAEVPKIFTNPEGWRPGGMLGAGGSSMLGGMSGGMMSGGMMSGGMPGNMRSGPGGGGASSTTSDDESEETSMSTEQVAYEPAHFVVVLCAVPYEKQVDEFKHTFENANGYDPSRDHPRYVAFRVERAEVPEDPNTPLEWVNVGGTSSALRAKQKWAGEIPEVANSLYTDPALTMSIPPVLMKDIKPYVNHPLIPLATEQLPSTMTASQPVAAAQEATGEQDEENASDIPSSNLLNNQGGAGVPGGTQGMGADIGMGGGAGASPGQSRGSSSMMMGGMGSSPNSMMGGMGSSPNSMMGGGGASMMPNIGNAVVAKYKLLRYFDFTAEPGKVYRYRVQLFVHDPNHPNIKEGYQDVPAQWLSDEAVARISKLDEAKGRVYYRLTDWSAESPSISLPPTQHFYAGSPSREKFVIDRNGAQIHREPLEADFTGVVWDEELGVDVSAKLESMVGTVLNQKGEIDVVHPLTLEFKILEDYDLQSQAVIADMRGGEPLGGKSTDPILSPVEAAVVDASGNLVVCNEIDDLDEYRRHAYVEDETAAGSQMQMGGSGMSGAGSGTPGGMMGGSGMPGGMMGGSGMEPGGMMPGGGGKSGRRGGGRRGR